MNEKFKLGVDIGGTFTDLVLINLDDETLFDEKVLTTPNDPSLGVISGIKNILEKNNISPKQLSHIIHGTTLVANSIIERRGSNIALITTKGFRDIQEIGTESRYDTYDLFMKMPESLVSREWRLEADERIGPKGEVITPLDKTEIKNLAKKIAESEIDAVAVSLLHSYLNPDHEREIRDILVKELPKTIVCISSEIMPEIGEYERTSTTVCNAFVLPTFKSYLDKLTNRLNEMGIKKDIYMMLSDGGTVHKSTAITFPIRLVQSGPAGGVQAVNKINKELNSEHDSENILCFDMGGTTAKACLIDNGKPMHANEFEVARVYRGKKGSGIPLKIPVIEMIEIGAGGGSIAKLDNLGLVRVGPESASADPGPACYGLGGASATVTDADLVLGYLDPHNFLGGDMELDIEAAQYAIKNTIADPLKISVIDAAWAIHETVNENMAQAAAIHALEKAKRISDYKMIPIGGAGPVHACNIALKLNLSEIVCPPGAGVASALGFLVSPMSFTKLQGGIVALDDLDFIDLRNKIEKMKQEGQALVKQADSLNEDIGTEILASMRYIGQGYSLEVEVDEESILSSSKTDIRDLFERVYREQFGRIEPEMQIEIVSWRVVTSGPLPKVNIGSVRSNKEHHDSKKGQRKVFFGPKIKFQEVPVYDRSIVSPGQDFNGAGIFEERESTIIVPPGSKTTIDESHNLIIKLPSETG